jgi:hypothetical protein
MNTRTVVTVTDYLDTATTILNRMAESADHALKLVSNSSIVPENVMDSITNPTVPFMSLTRGPTDPQGFMQWYNNVWASQYYEARAIYAQMAVACIMAQIKAKTVQHKFKQVYSVLQTSGVTEQMTWLWP